MVFPAPFLPQQAHRSRCRSGKVSPSSIFFFRSKDFLKSQYADVDHLVVSSNSLTISPNAWRGTPSPAPPSPGVNRARTAGTPLRVEPLRLRTGVSAGRLLPPSRYRSMPNRRHSVPISRWASAVSAPNSPMSPSTATAAFCSPPPAYGCPPPWTADWRCSSRR